MRSAWLVLLVLLAAGFAFPAADAADKPLLSDPENDTNANLFGQPTMPFQNPQFASADLKALQIVESDEAFDFVLAVASLKSTTDSVEYQIQFDFRNMSYNADLYRQLLPTGEASEGGYLRAHSTDRNDSTDACYYGCYMAQLKPKLDVDKGTVAFSVRKAYVLDGMQRMPNRGDSLANVHVDADAYVTGIQGGISVSDRMPDSDGASFPVTIGDIANGHLALSSPDKVRVSNGGAATFVYKVTIRNTGDAEDTVDLAIHDEPAGWNGTVTTPLKVPGNGQKTFSVLMSVPFAHVHGGFDAFNLTAQSQNDPGSNAVVRLGILHTPIPQPAGHHNELYLHPDFTNSGLSSQAFPYATGVINTEKPTGDEAAKEINGGCCSGNNGGRVFYLPLNPALQMGLDFDLNKTGTVAGSIAGHGVGTGKLSARLYLQTSENGRTKQVLLAKTSTQDLTLDTSAPSAFSLQLTPTPESDYVPYAPKQNLLLLVTLESGELSMPCCLNAGVEPKLKVDGFKMVLPLNEYADRLTGLSEAASAIDLKADGPVEKAGRPGTLLTYTFTLKNTGFSADTFVVETAGNDADRASLLPADEIELAPKESREITLGVQIPADMKDGQTLDVLVFAHAKSDPSKAAIARTKTTVATTGNATSDEAKLFLAKQGEAKDTPGFGLVGLVAAAGAAVLLARRRS